MVQEGRGGEGRGEEGRGGEGRGKGRRGEREGIYLVSNCYCVAIGTPANVDILSFGGHSVRRLSNYKSNESTQYWDSKGQGSKVKVQDSPLASHILIVLSPEAVTSTSGFVGCQLS